MNALLELRGIHKRFSLGEKEVEILRGRSSTCSQGSSSR